jgi:ketosteroid isomerase-like protein
VRRCVVSSINSPKVLGTLFAQNSNGGCHETQRLGSYSLSCRSSCLGGSVWAQDVRPAMEAANAQFLAAFNNPNPAAFPSLYTADGILIFHGGPPITGPEAIRQFWESRIKAGAKNHTFEIINTWVDGKYAYQFARASVELIPDTGEKILISGHTVRIFERQDDGTWKTKIHMFNRLGGP